MASWILVKSPLFWFLWTVSVYEGKSLFLAALNTECLRLPTNLTHFMNSSSGFCLWLVVFTFVCFLGRNRRPLVWHCVCVEQSRITRIRKNNMGACDELNLGIYTTRINILGFSLFYRFRQRYKVRPVIYGLCDFSICICIYTCMCMLFRGGRVFGSSVMELGGKWQKGRGHGAVPFTST